MTPPNVYAQQTDFNLRLCSLLSAVLNRSLRPDFVAAIELKADTLKHTNRLQQPVLFERPHLGLVFVGPLAAIEILAQRIPKFSREYEFDVATVPVRPSQKAPLTTLVETLQNLQKSIHFFNQTGRPVVMVSISSGVDVSYQYLSSAAATVELEGNILGVVAVDPPHHDTVASVATTIPILVALSWNETQLVDTDHQLYLAHPNVILVQHNNSEIYGIDWEHCTLDDNDKLSSSSSTERIISIHQTYWLWLVRTIAKFSEAVAILDPNSHQKKVEGGSGMVAVADTRLLLPSKL